jgi:GTP-binding protein
VAFITASEGRNVQAMLDLAQHLFKQSHLRVGTGQLNQAVKQVFSERTPSTPAGQRVKVLYATQIETAPPTIVLFVNNPDWVSESYQRFIINRFRELLPYPEVPIRLILRGRGEKRGEDALAEGGTGPRSAPQKKKSRKPARHPPGAAARGGKPRSARKPPAPGGRRGGRMR